MQTGKKALSLVLALAMIVSTFASTAAFAASTVQDQGNWYDSNESDPVNFVDSTNAWTNVDFQQEEFPLGLGGQFNLSGYVRIWKVGGPEVGETLTDASDYIVPNSWASSDPDIASVDENGQVTAAQTGSATITVQVNGTHRGDGEHKDSNSYATWTLSCTVTVQDDNTVPVTGITLDQSKMTLGVGKTDYLEATVTPEDATDQNVTWTSSDESVATVGEYGEVTAVGAGTATITAKSGDVSATCEVTVTDAQYDYSIDYADYLDQFYDGDDSLLIYKGEKQLFTWNDAVGDVAWSSSQPGVATVDENGIVSPVKAGKTFIIGKCGGQTIYFKLTIEDDNDGILVTRDNATGVKLIPDSLTMAVGKEDRLSLFYYNPDPAYSRFAGVEDSFRTYSSSDETVATVDEDGRITAVGAGTATVTAEVAGTKTTGNPDGFEDKTLTCTVKVLDVASKQTVGYAYSENGFEPNQTVSLDYSNENPSSLTVNFDGAVPLDTSKETAYFKVQCEPEQTYLFRAKINNTYSSTYFSNTPGYNYNKEDGTAIIAVPMSILKKGTKVSLQAVNRTGTARQGSEDFYWNLTYSGGSYNPVADLQPFVGVYKNNGNTIEICKDGAIKYNDVILNHSDLDDSQDDTVDAGYGRYNNTADFSFNVSPNGNTITLDTLDITAVREGGAHWDTDNTYQMNGSLEYDAQAKTLTYYSFNDDGDWVAGEVYSLSAGSSDNGSDNSGSNHHSDGGSTGSGTSGNTTAPSTPSTTTTTTSPTGSTVASVTTQPDTAPVVTGNSAAVTVTVPADVASVISTATAANPAEVKIAAPAAAIMEQLQNSAVQSVNLTIQVPAAVANNANPNVKVSINADQAVLQAAKDAQKDITLRVTDAQTGKEAYSWTFSGADLKNSVASVTNVNLALSVAPVTSDTAASTVVAGNNASKAPSGIMLKFGGSGLLPAPAAVRVYVGNQAGCTPNSKIFLYYLNGTTNALEQLPQSQYTVDADGYVTVIISHCSEYVLLPQAATNPYPVKSDTSFPVGVKSGKTYTYAMTVTGKAAPSFTVGNGKAFTGTVKHQGNKYYFTVKAIGAAGTMTAVYSTLPGQKPVVMSYVAVAK